MADWRDDRVGSSLRGENPTVLARLPAGFAVIGDVQWLPGYCLLLTDDPLAQNLFDLDRAGRRQFFDSLDLLAEAVQVSCREHDEDFRRVNIEILGNSDPFLQAHVWPRYDWEPPELRRRPVWLYPPERWSDSASALGPQHDALRRSIHHRLTE